MRDAATGSHADSSRRLAAVRRLFAAHADPYAGADLENAKRLGAALWVIGAAIAVALLPFAAPTIPMGDAGWAVAAGLVASCLLGAARLMRGGIGFNHLLVAPYVGVAQVAVLEWLAGGEGTHYDQLYLLTFMFCAAVHPPRRAIPCLAFGSAAFLAPLAYSGFELGSLVGGITQLLLWWGLSLVTMALMQSVRLQRIEGESASRLARVDQLTGLGNRRAFEEALRREAARAGRGGEELSLVVLDVDGFKEINDRHGHPAGDRCLQRVAELLLLTVRDGDACFRWGGDEFAVVLPQTGPEVAEQVRDRLVENVRSARVGPGEMALGISCGVATASGAPQPDELVADADMDLYLAKRRIRPPQQQFTG